MSTYKGSVQSKTLEAVMKKQVNKKTNKSDKENGIHKRHALVLKTLDALERGMYTGGLDIHWCGDSIGWLWKWKKITKYARCKSRAFF